MTDEATSPLRRRMIEDMTIRKLAPKTQRGYIRTVKDYGVPRPVARHASFGDVRRAFRWKDYRGDGHDRQKVMTLASGEFIRRS
jgi:hypothetical protein